jgi:CubicO group peptidase (beta-lactamase class C family)
MRSYAGQQYAPSFLADAPIDEHVGFLLEVRDRAGRLTAHSARSYTPPRPATQSVLIVRNEMMEAWEAIVVEVEPAAPHRIVSLEYNGARPPTDEPPPKALSEAEALRRLGALVDRMAKAGRFSGTMLVAKDGRILLTRATGIANRDFGAPVRFDTRFNLGSMNKMFTAVAVMQLVEQGRLSLEDPVGKWLGDDWLPRALLDRVRVKHLLTHTSGLGSYFNEIYDRTSREAFRAVDDYKPLVRGDSLRFEPGTDWRYSNTGMLLAGAVIEKASGQDYFDYVRAHIYAPAGMDSTDCYSLDEVNPNLAVGYEPQRVGDRTVVRNNLYRHVLRGGPAGGGYSTVGDLLRFERALRSGRLVRPESLEQLWRPYPELHSGHYGLGFGIESTPLGKVVGHSGGFFGISAILDIHVDAGYTVAVLANQGGVAPQVAGAATRLLAQARSPR